METYDFCDMLEMAENNFDEGYNPIISIRKGEDLPLNDCIATVKANFMAAYMDFYWRIADIIRKGEAKLDNVVSIGSNSQGKFFGESYRKAIGGVEYDESGQCITFFLNHDHIPHEMAVALSCFNGDEGFYMDAYSFSYSVS